MGNTNICHDKGRKVTAPQPRKGAAVQAVGLAFDSQPTLLTGSAPQAAENQTVQEMKGIFDNIGSLSSPRTMSSPRQPQQLQTPPRREQQRQYLEHTSPPQQKQQMQQAPSFSQSISSADSFALQQGFQFAAQFSAIPTCTPEQQICCPPTPDELPASPREQPQQRVPQQSGAATRFQEIPNTVALAPNVERLDPMVIQELLRSGGCILVDVRSDDRASGTIQGAVNVKAIDNVPFLSKVPELVQTWKNQPLIVFHCQYSAHRAPTCANWYREQAPQNQRVAIMDGGFRGWESSGLPVASATGQQGVGGGSVSVPAAMQQNHFMPGVHAQHSMMTPVRHMQAAY